MSSGNSETKKSRGDRLFEVLEPARLGDLTSRFFDLAMMTLILASVVAAVLRSVAQVEHRFSGFFDHLEVVTVVVFVLEYLARFATCDRLGVHRYQTPFLGRLRYLLSTPAVIDLLAFAPFFFTLLFTVDPEVAHVLPLLRVLKLMRYSPALETLTAVLYLERRSLGAAAIIMLVLLLFSSSVVYLVERDAQPEIFSSIPDSMWWGISTLTTVGYGDVTPVTPLGKLFGAIVTVLGIAMFALPAGILATGFAQEIKQREFLVTWNLVAGVPIFADLKAHGIARIARLLVPRVVQAGQVVVRRGEAADCMFFIVSGDLEVALEDRTLILHDDFFGEIALLSSGPRSATVTARTRAQLLVLHAAHFQAFLDAHPELAETIRRVAEARIAESGIRETTVD